MAWSEIMTDNGIVAWGIAFLLAVGGTAVVVAAWLQFRRTWKSLPAGLKGRASRRRRPDTAAPARTLAAERPQENRDPRRAVQAYRGQTAPAAPAPAAASAPRPAPAPPAPPALAVEALDAYLDRLHHAVDELEAAAGARA